MSVEVRQSSGIVDHWIVQCGKKDDGTIYRRPKDKCFVYRGFTADELRFIATFLDKQMAKQAEAATPELEAAEMSDEQSSE